MAQDVGDACDHRHRSGYTQSTTEDVILAYKDNVTDKCIARSLFTNALPKPHHRYSVVHHSNMHFPLPTPQYKAVMSGDNQIDAGLQAARDGALIVHYVHQFYSYAHPDCDPSQLETCHYIEGGMYLCIYLRPQTQQHIG
jgi:hypothetical protein